MNKVQYDTCKLATISHSFAMVEVVRLTEGNLEINNNGLKFQLQYVCSDLMPAYISVVFLLAFY